LEGSFVGIVVDRRYRRRIDISSAYTTATTRSTPVIRRRQALDAIRGVIIGNRLLIFVRPMPRATIEDDLDHILTTVAWSRSADLSHG
jgi:hypothetical protein